MNMYMCMKINYINSPFIKLKVVASLCSPTTSSAMPDCHAEQLEFLVYGIRFARFYFRIISLPNLSNRNHSLPEPWRHARVHAIWWMHTSVKRSPLHNNRVTTFTIHVINVMFRHSNNQNMSTLYLTPPPPPIWVPKPLVAIDKLGWAISLRKLNIDLEEKTK